MIALGCLLLAGIATARLAGWVGLAPAERAAAALAAAPMLLAAVGAVAASGFGISTATLVVATLALAASALLAPPGCPLGTLPRPHPGTLVVGGALTGTLGLTLLLAFQRTVIVGAEGGISTGTANNLGDLPLHLGLTTLFAFGDSLPPTTPQLAGSPLAYPFLPDLLSALLHRAGLSLGPALWLPSLAAVAGLCLLVARLTFRASRSLAAALFAPLLPLFAGGLEWLALPALADGPKNLADAIGALYPGHPGWGIVWKTPLLALFLPQRATAAGLPLVAATVLLLWIAVRPPPPPHPSLRPWIAVGLLAGLLPFVFPHGLLSLGLFAPLAVLASRPHSLRGPLLSASVAAFVALPQLLWLRRALAGRPSPIAWQPGWMASEVGLDGGAGFVAFWLLNLGPLLPATAVALLLRHRMGLAGAGFWAAALGIWLLAAFVRLAPWSWDNSKVLLVFVTLAAVPVASLFGTLWGRGLPGRIGAIVLLACQCGSGLLLTGWSLLAESPLEEYTPAAVEVALEVRRHTPTDALLLEAPHHAPLAYLAGRRLVVGYPGHLWSHGLDGDAITSEVESFYRALATPRTTAEWQRMALWLERRGVTHVVLGRVEEERYGASPARLLAHLPLVWHGNGVSLFAVTHPTASAHARS